MRRLQAAAVTYRIALGSRAGQKVLTLRGAMPRETTAQPTPVRRHRRFQPARGRTGRSTRPQATGATVPLDHPALSDERVKLNAAGQVELRLKTPWCDGTTHLVMSPLEFIEAAASKTALRKANP